MVHMTTTTVDTIRATCASLKHEGQVGVTLEKLEKIVNNVDPAVWSDNLGLLFQVADVDCDGMLSEDELASLLDRVTGRSIPDGAQKDDGVSNIYNYLTILRAYTYSKKNIKMVKEMLSSIVELLDHRVNPQAFEMCQRAFLDFDNGEAVFFILELSQHAPSDDARSLALATIMLAMFSNSEVANAVAASKALLPAVRAGVADHMHPVRMSAVQLAQAIAAQASPGEMASSVVPALVHAIQPLLTGQPFQPITSAALDMLISASFHCPDVVAQVATWPFILSVLREEEDERHVWLSSAPQQIMLCGLLAVNMLRICEPGNEATASAQAELRGLLSAGHFFNFLPMAFEAAVERREWPLSSGAYHSPARLARITQMLAELRLGFNELQPVLPLLAKAVETAYASGESVVVTEALRGLLLLSREDVGCLETIAALDAFRAGLLSELANSNDEVACALVDYLQAYDFKVAAARATRDVCLTYCKHAPTVERLSRCFARFAYFDETITLEQVKEAVRLVPIGPSAELNILSNCAAMSFVDFAHQVYGTPEVLGFWPSLMEDIVAEREYVFDGETLLEIPSLTGLISAYESACAGCTEGVSPERLLSHALPELGLPTDENRTVEAAFDEVKFEPPMLFKPFVRWVHELCLQLKQASEAGDAEA